MDFTQSVSQDGRDRAGSSSPTHGPYLVLVLHCARPIDSSHRFPLSAFDEVVVGRGPVSRTARDGRTARFDVSDGSLSETHFVMRCLRGRWRLADAKSKNGTSVNGARVEEAEMQDGHVIEAARSLFVFRNPGDHAPAPVGWAAGAAGVVPELPGFETHNSALGITFAMLARVATTNVSVLVCGETGTGKELIARAVHTLSGRTGPFVAVNCGALPDTLLQSELFGHRKGAFSGATESRPGLMRAADRGTLFLDEVAELSPSSQAALLRALQEKEVLPLGETRAVSVDVRVVAATHRDLPALCTSAAFRADLYARIAGHVVHLPPLRERREDLGVIVSRLLTGIDSGGDARFSRAAARALLAYDWPQNVRELANVLTVSLALSDDGRISTAMLPAPIREAELDEPSPSAPANAERTRLVELFRIHRGNTSAVARALGTSRSQVARLVERHGVDPKQFVP